MRSSTAASAGILAWLTGALAAPARANGLVTAGDLRADALEAERRRLPLLVVYTLPDCKYCDLALRDFIGPLAREQPQRLLVREVKIDSRQPLRDFSGGATSHADFAVSQAAKIAPTVMLYVSSERVGAPLVGIAVPDFYGEYLEQAIARAVARLRERSRPSPPAH